MSAIDARLSELGLTLPDAAPPVANYVPFVVTGKQVFISGQISRGMTGKVGADFTVEEGVEAAKICALSLIAQFRAACGGDLDRVARVVKLVGFVNSVPAFTDQPKVINGASDLMVAVFGDAGRHARSAVSAASLPAGVAVEIEAVIELK